MENLFISMKNIGYTRTKGGVSGKTSGRTHFMIIRLCQLFKPLRDWAFFNELPVYHKGN